MGRKVKLGDWLPARGCRVLLQTWCKSGRRAPRTHNPRVHCPYLYCDRGLMGPVDCVSSTQPNTQEELREEKGFIICLNPYVASYPVRQRQIRPVPFLVPTNEIIPPIYFSSIPPIFLFPPSSFFFSLALATHPVFIAKGAVDNTRQGKRRSKRPRLPRRV